ncbi:MAG TPA: SCP2 sterol-binding domain-containing protein [Archangium sp.]
MIEQFFQRQLPVLVLQSLHDFVLQEGLVHFVVGDDTWSFAFGAEEPIQRGLVGDADLELRFSQSAFEQFLEGTLDAPAAVRAGEVSGSGDFTLLERFARILRPPSDTLWGGA